MSYFARDLCVDGSMNSWKSSTSVVERVLGGVWGQRASSSGQVITGRRKAGAPLPSVPSEGTARTDTTRGSTSRPGNLRNRRVVLILLWEALWAPPARPGAWPPLLATRAPPPLGQLGSSEESDASP